MPSPQAATAAVTPTAGLFQATDRNSNGTPTLAILAVTTVLAWGVLAFGAVYAWAAWPMVSAVAVIALWHWRPSVPRSTVVWSSLLVVAAIGVQLVPLATATVAATSPGAATFLTAFDVAYANGVVERHALSIDPARTLRALGFFLLWLAWVPACATLIGKPRAARLLARNIAIVATIVAIIGLAQNATFNGKLLWFWTPQFYATNGFGPFVNRNHFAGWMLLALSLSVGLLFARVSRSAPPPNATLRERVLWFGSPAASPVLLTAAAALAMACSLVWTMSRSGIVSAAAALGILTAAAIYRLKGSLKRWVLAGYVLFAALGVVAWRGTDTLFDWYGNTGTLQWRIQLWKDTLPAVEAFWLTGAGVNTYGTLMVVQPRTDMTIQPREAHNDYLQLAVEGGVLVCIPAVLLAFAVGREILRALKVPQDDVTWWIRMGSVAGICAIAVQEVSEFSLHIPAVALLFSTCLAIALHRPEASTSRCASQSLISNP
jgi:O-antigen ligase